MKPNSTGTHGENSWDTNKLVVEDVKQGDFLDGNGRRARAESIAYFDAPVTVPHTLTAITSVEGDFKSYHGSGGKRGQYTKIEDRKFIAWDGEGMNLRGTDKPQCYVLFGCSTGARIKTRSSNGLPIFDILNFMISVKERHPTAFHVAFAFDYDVNMIVQGLSDKHLRMLKDTGTVRLRESNGTAFRLSYTPKKWFRVTRYLPGYSRRRNPNACTSICIEDLFTFYAKSFIETLREYNVEVPEDLVKGKAARGAFSLDEWDFMESYWETEIKLLAQLAENFRDILYRLGFKISRWYGPGVIASFVMKQHNIKQHMYESPKEVLNAALHAYAGGRFEPFYVGRIPGPIYSADINSAYPDAIRHLPSLSNGRWERVRSPTGRTMFALYRIRLGNGQATGRIPGPFFWRDHKGHISFPPYMEGWYWAPEVYTATQFRRKDIQILDGWEFIESDSTLRPFAFIEGMYNKRQALKKAGDHSQLGLKLAMNSIYGKLAQRVGWNERNRRVPPWHQIEWAGWITSYCRAKILGRILRDPLSVIAVETDGFYTTTAPERLGINHTKELGGWEVDEYDEIIYIQSGVAVLSKNGERTTKVRGLDKQSFTPESVDAYLTSLPVLIKGEFWEPYQGTTTRFTTMGQALQSATETRFKHCVWQTDIRAIDMGGGRGEGKRVHSPLQCRACKEGIRPCDGGHDLLVRSATVSQYASYGNAGLMSAQHYIPWLGNTTKPEWLDNDDKGLDTTSV